MKRVHKLGNEHLTLRLSCWLKQGCQLAEGARL
jgi:hypothetical protein